MNDELNEIDLNFILESLKYTRLKFEESTEYPSYEYKQGRIEEVNQVMEKVRKLKQTFKDW